MVGRDDMSMELGLVSRHDVGGREGVGVRAPLPSPPAGEGGELNILVPACGHRFWADYAWFWRLQAAYAREWAAYADVLEIVSRLRMCVGVWAAYAEVLEGFPYDYLRKILQGSQRMDGQR